MQSDGLQSINWAHYSTSACPVQVEAVVASEKLNKWIFTDNSSHQRAFLAVSLCESAQFFLFSFTHTDTLCVCTLLVRFFSTHILLIRITWSRRKRITKARHTEGEREQVKQVKCCKDALAYSQWSSDTVILCNVHRHLKTRKEQVAYNRTFDTHEINVQQ